MPTGRRFVVLSLLLVLGLFVVGAGSVAADGEWRETDPNTSTTVEPGEPLTEEQQDQLVQRTMVRLEEMRNITFEYQPRVEIKNRSAAMADRGSAHPSNATRLYTNTVKQGLFYVGVNDDAVAVQEENRNTTVAGYYRIGEGEIVLVTDADGAIDESILAHELLHAWQDQRFDLTEFDAETRDGASAMTGLIEGDAVVVERAYAERCQSDWSCILSSDSPTADSSDLNWGIYFADFHPYNDGPTLVESRYETGGWEGVNALYTDPPRTTRHLLEPHTYDEFAPKQIPLTRSPVGGWSALGPSDGPMAERLGPGRIAAMFMQMPYTDAPAESESPLDRAAVLSPDESTPFEYQHDFTDAWAGDRFHAYQRGESTAYVWRIAWSDAAAADDFLAAYQALLRSHGAGFEGDEMALIPDGDFAGAYHVAQDDNTITIVHAPERAALLEVAPGIVGTDDVNTVFWILTMAVFVIAIAAVVHSLLTEQDG